MLMAAVTVLNIKHPAVVYVSSPKTVRRVVNITY
jgi:hypothetical protein